MRGVRAVVEEAQRNDSVFCGVMWGMRASLAAVLSGLIVLAVRDLAAICNGSSTPRTLDH